MLKTLEFNDEDSRLIWGYSYVTQGGHKIEINICASYVCRVLSHLELSFWMRIKDGDEVVPYNITHTYSGAQDELEVIETDLGRFSRGAVDRFAVQLHGAADRYRLLQLHTGHYPIRFPGPGGVELEVFVPRVRMATCVWVHDENHGFYQASCGYAYQFDHEFETGNAYRFCPHCGKSIVLRAESLRPEERWIGAPLPAGGNSLQLSPPPTLDLPEVSESDREKSQENQTP